LLAALPEANPYRISIENRPRDADTDSLYVQAESDLQRRLVEIRMLFDTTAVIVQPQDAVDEEAVQQQPEQEAEDDRVAF
jgi:DNA-dependent RNA polymerase auxiliary subunit epsilon